jgi:hypothetical protein
MASSPIHRNASLLVLKLSLDHMLDDGKNNVERAQNMGNRAANVFAMKRAIQRKNTKRSGSVQFSNVLAQ